MRSSETSPQQCEKINTREISSITFPLISLVHNKIASQGIKIWESQ